MTKLAVTIALLAVPVAFAQVSTWGQCGGIGFTGSTVCVSGSYCSKLNDYYSQCLPGTASTTTAATPTTTTATSKTSTAVATSTGAPKYIFSFGDSYSQSGFSITGTKPAAGNPMGNPTFPGYTSSGGINWLGYLDTIYNPVTVLNYNFAAGGATINSTIVNSDTPLTTQVATFLSNMGTPPSYAPWTGANSLFVIWIGINDIGNTYYQSVDQSALHTKMMDTYFGLVQQMYNVGARSFLFLSVPPVEKTPLMLAQDISARNSEATQIADFNSKIVSRAAAFASGKSGVKVYHYDSQIAFNKIIASPTTYGYNDATTVCEASTCMWWNNYHPSTMVHKVVAGEVADVLKTGFW